MIKNIIFDMGNVLLRFDPEVSLQAYLDNDADRAIIRKELFEAPEWLMADEGKITNAERYEPVSKRVPEYLHEVLHRFVDNWHICLTPIAGAKEFIDYCKEKGYHLYVLSNADDTFHNYFPKAYPLSLFEGITVSSDVKMIKPHRCIYEYFLSHHGLNADECLFIDDRAENIEGAKELGIHGFVFCNNYDRLKEEYQL